MKKVFMRTVYMDSGFGCSCDLLPGWTVSGSKDFKKFDAYVKESLDFYIECAREDGDEYPAIFDGEYKIQYIFDTRALLQYLQPTLTFSALQELTGINQKQLAHYAAGRSNPRPIQRKRIIAGIHQLVNKLQSAAF